MCRLGDPCRLEAVVHIAERMIPSVHDDQLVELFPDQLRGECLTSHIGQVSQQDVDTTAGRFAGDDPGPSEAAQPGTSKARGAGGNVYQASVPLDVARPVALVGGRGRAKIHAGARTLGARLWDSLCHTFRLELVR